MTPPTRFLRSGALVAGLVQALLLLVVLSGTAAGVQPLGENLALRRSYALLPAPNYRLCTDPGDRTQLTDGQTTKQYFWTQQGTVGWEDARYATITLDLGRVEPIGGAAFHTAAGKGNVHWPAVIHILTSDDGTIYRDAGDLVALDHEVHGPWPEGYAIRWLSTSKLHTRGRFVRFLILSDPGSFYIFCDEVEVFRGPAGLLRANLSGRPVGDLEEFFAGWRGQRGIQRRFEADIAALRKVINGAAVSREATRQALLHRLISAAEGLKRAPVAVGWSFRVVLPLSDAHARLFQVQAALWKAQGAPELSCWVPAAWDPVELMAPLPQRGSSAIDVHTMRGEHRSAALNVANSGSRPREVRLHLEGLPGAPLPQYVTVHAALWTDTVEGQPVIAALPEARRGSRDWQVTLFPGLVGQVWMEFHVTDLPAGRHEGSLIVQSERTAPLRVPVRLHVYPLDFPRRTSLLLGGWDYTEPGGSRGITPQNRTALVEHLRRRYVNAPWAKAGVMMQMQFVDDDTVRLKTQAFDEWISQWPNAERYSVFLAVRNSFAGAKIRTPEFDRRVGTWISAWVRHLQSKGIGAERFGLALRDEPHEGTDLEPLVAWAKAIRRAEPEVLIWENPTYRDPVQAPPELFELCHVLCPNRPMWLTRGEPFARFYLDQQRQGRELEFYSCSGPAHLLDPYSYYRLQAWHCWQIGATGSFFWSFSDNGGASSWNPYLAAAGPFTPLFLDPQGVTGGKHMEAIRESVEDFEYLVMLRQAVEEAKAAGRSGAALARADALLQTAAGEVLTAQGAHRLRWHEPKDRTIADRVRVRILEALVSLRDTR